MQQQPMQQQPLQPLQQQPPMFNNKALSWGRTMSIISVVIVCEMLFVTFLRYFSSWYEVFAQIISTQQSATTEYYMRSLVKFDSINPDNITTIYYSTEAYYAPIADVFYTASYFVSVEFILGLILANFIFINLKLCNLIRYKPIEATLAIPKIKSNTTKIIISAFLWLIIGQINNNTFSQDLPDAFVQYNKLRYSMTCKTRNCDSFADDETDSILYQRWGPSTGYNMGRNTAFLSFIIIICTLIVNHHITQLQRTMAVVYATVPNSIGIYPAGYNAPMMPPTAYYGAQQGPPVYAPPMYSSAPPAYGYETWRRWSDMALKDL
jgi:hypothetical protein